MAAMRSISNVVNNALEGKFVSGVVAFRGVQVRTQGQGEWNFDLGRVLFADKNILSSVVFGVIGHHTKTLQMQDQNVGSVKNVDKYGCVSSGDRPK
jgi:hypothetical protein